MTAGTRYLFFGGKGGTGKTTCAAAAAFAAAERGQRVLAISTDPAHSLGDVFRRRLGPAPTTIPIRRGSLYACELDADSALPLWLGRRRPALAAILERGTWLARPDIESFLDLALPGVDELLGLVEIERLSTTREYDVVVVDTAPTGHTLRLLATPSTLTHLAHTLDLMQEKHRVVAAALTHAVRADASDALIQEIGADGARLASLLRDARRTAVRWVMLPEALSLAESTRAINSLRADGIPVSDVVVNRLTPPPPSACHFCDGRRRAESIVVETLRASLGILAARAWAVPAQDEPPRGRVALAALTRAMTPLNRWKGASGGRSSRPQAAAAARANRAATAIAGGPATRLLIVGGKGGVGKTTCATALALAIARRRPATTVLLLSTDPAHSLGDVLGHRVGNIEQRIRGGPANLIVRELDAAAGWRARVDRYRGAVAQLFGAHDVGGHATLAVDRAIVEELLMLAPPGIDEIAGMLTVVDALFPAPRRTRLDLVVVDTAPTGHALRLLAMPAHALAWVRQFMKAILDFEGMPGFGDLASELLVLSRGLARLDRLLHAPRASGFVVVTRPEAMAILETTRLVDWLDVHGIARRGLIVNGFTPGECRRCVRAAARERGAAANLTRGAAWGRVAATDAVAAPPRGVRQIAAWTATWRLSP